MGINCSTPFKCLGCNLDCKEETNLCLHAYRDVKQLALEKDTLLASKIGQQDKYCTTYELDVWMANVENLCCEIESILNKKHHNCLFFYQRYNFGYDVAEKLKLGRVLHNQLVNLRTEKMIVEKSNIDQLRIGIKTISAKKVDLENCFRYREFTEVLKNWMAEVHEQSERGNAILRKVADVDEQRDNIGNNSANRDEANGTPSHQIGEGIFELLNIIAKLQEQEKGWDVNNILVKKSHSVVEEHFWYSPQLIGVDLKVKEVLEHLSGDEFSIITIFGDGGIGKTTLLREINNTLYNDKSKNRFSRVIFVTVSQTWSNSKIQWEIASRLGFSNENEFVEANVEKNAQVIYDALGRDSFLLLLDDIWMDLDFRKIGIRQPGESAKNSKIVLTSRFENICSSTGVGKSIRMEYLDKEASWQLFFEACGGKQNEALLQSNVQEVARDVVKLCGGLPLALTVIGRALGRLERMDDWEEAKQQLLESTEDKMKPVLQVLRYSFDRLEGDVAKSCFLFCLLFGQSVEIDEDELVDYWIGEGLLPEDQFSTLRGLRSRGREVVRILVQACLLQKIEKDLYINKGNSLRMHDMIYSMAMWIESENRGPRTVIIRDGKARSIENATRAYIIRDPKLKRQGTTGMESLKLCCPSLTTLTWIYIEDEVADDFYIEDEVADDFFEQMLCLRVLHLIFYPSSRLPCSIYSLEWLRSLSLCGANIEELPVEFGRLVNLLLLDLSLTFELRYIPKGAISPLVNLLSLNMRGSAYRYPVSMHDLEELPRLEGLIQPHVRSAASLHMRMDQSLYRHLDEKKEGQVSLHDLEELPRLEELMLPEVGSVEELHLLSTFPRLSKLPRELQLTEVVCNMTLFHVLEHFPNLESLRIFSFSVEEGSLAGSRDLGALGNRLRRLYISSCHNLSTVHVSWLLRQLPNLEHLSVSRCDRLEKLYCVQADDGAPSTMNCLSKLKSMRLTGLPELSSIADGQLAFISLVELEIVSCTKLRKLSFPFVERERKIRIFCHDPGWQDLEWPDDGSKSMFIQVDT